MLNIKRHKIEVPKPLPEAITKLAIGKEGGLNNEIKYEYSTCIKCFQCHGITTTSDSSSLKERIDKILSFKTPTQQDSISWEEDEKLPCPHTLDPLPQVPRPLSNATLSQCACCDLRENLWLCLTCGELGCGRKQWGPNAPAGNNHAVDHFNKFHHPVAVKLGTITPEGLADVHCYACDNVPAFNYGEIIDPKLAGHLASFGINVLNQEKNVKNLSEMQIEQNIKYDFTSYSEDGISFSFVFVLTCFLILIVSYFYFF